MGVARVVFVRRGIQEDAGSASSERLAQPGTSLLVVAVRARLPLGRSCRGVGICGSCRVRVLEGHDRLSSRTPWEAPLPADERLACQARIDIGAASGAATGAVVVTTDYW